MGSVGIGVDLGPRSSADAVAVLDRRDPDRLILRRLDPGCLHVGGLVLLMLGALLAVGWFAGVGSGWRLAWGVVLGPLGALVALAEAWVVVDRRRRVVVDGVSLVVPVVFRRHATTDFERVVLDEDVDGTRSDGETGPTTTFEIRLEGAKLNRRVAVAGVWEAAVPVAEALSRFLEIPFQDRAAARTQQPAELDLPVAQQERPAGGMGSKGLDRPADPRCTLENLPDGGVGVAVPLPDGRAALGIALVVFVLWTIPVSLFGSIWIGLLPLAVVLASWVKVAFGYRADLEIRRDRLEVRTRGLVARRHVTIPAAELEDVIVRDLEWGGPRSTLAHMLDGVIVARSDRTAVRFGHGLSEAELVWLRRLILDKVGQGVELELRAAAEWDVRGALGLRLAVGGLIGAAIGLVAGLAMPFPMATAAWTVGAAVGLLIGASSSGSLRAVSARAAVDVTVMLILVWLMAPPLIFGSGVSLTPEAIPGVPAVDLAYLPVALVGCAALGVVGLQALRMLRVRFSKGK
jgi:hypothetical protein